MAKVYPFQQTFSGGQVSPFMAARSDLAAYKESVQTLQNFVCDARGPVRMRTGTKYLNQIPFESDEQRLTANLIPLDLSTFTQANEGKDAVAVFYDGMISIYDSDGVPQMAAEIYDCVGEENEIQYAVLPDASKLFLTSRKAGLKQITYEPGEDENGDPTPPAFAFGNISGLEGLDTPTDYEADPVVPGVPMGNPGAICLYQGRMWLGGFSNVAADPTADPPVVECTGQLMTIAGSATGHYNVYTLSNPTIEEYVPLANDPVRYEISSDGTINWLVGQRTLVIGTTYGEFTANTPEGEGVLGAEVLPDIIQQSAYGSTAQQPEKIAQGIFYVTNDNERLRDIRYQWVANGYLSADISFLFKGSTSSRGLPFAGKANHFIKQAYSQNPFSILWLPDRNGGMSGCSFEMVTGEKSVFGWSVHPTAGAWKSVAVTQSSGRSTTWCLVDRGIKVGENDPSENGPRTLTLERGMLPDEEVYMDCYTECTTTPLTVEVGQGIIQARYITERKIPFLKNLVGKEVRVTIQAGDDEALGETPPLPIDPIFYQSKYEAPASLPIQTVESGPIGEDGVNLAYIDISPTPGTVLHEKPYPDGTIVRVGFPYTAKLVTLPMDWDFKAGSAMAWKKRWNKIVLRVFESAIPIVNGQRLPTTFPSTPMGVGQPSLQQADLVYRNLSWDDTGRITIEQDEPLRTTILGIFGAADIDSL